MERMMSLKIHQGVVDFQSVWFGDHPAICNVLGVMAEGL